MTWRRSSAVLGLVLAALFLGPSTLRATGNLETVTQSGSAIASVAWDSSLIPIPWYFNNPSTVSGCSYNSPNAPASALQPAIAAAFATWQANPLSTQSYTYAGTTTVRNVGADGLNVVTFCDLVVLGSDQGYLARTPTTALTQQMTVTAGGGCPSGQGLLDLNGPPNPPGFCFPVGTYPAGTIVDSDVEYNTYSTNEQDFSTNHTAGTYDIQALTTHELGHFIGLSHDPLSDSVMYAYADDEPPSDGVGQRVLKEPDLTTAGRYYPSAQFQADRGSITGIITLDGARADGVHVVAIDPNTLRGVSGRFSVSRFEDSTILYGPEGADFAANGAGHYRIDGLAPGAYYVYVEYFDGSEFWSDRLSNHYNTTVGNSNVSNGSSTSSGQVGGWLGFLPKLAEFYDSSESGNGGDGMNPGTAADNSDAAALVTVSAGAETSGIDIAINIEPVNGQTPANRQNPTTRTTLANDQYTSTAGDIVTAFLLNGGGDDYYAIRFPASSLPAPPYNVAEGLFTRAGLNTAPYDAMLALPDPNAPTHPDMAHPIVASASRVLTGGRNGQTAASDVIDVRDQWNVTINSSTDLFVVLHQPDAPGGISLLTQGYFYLVTRTSTSTCRVCRTLLTQNGGATWGTLTADVFYDLISEADPPVMINSVSPASLGEGDTATVTINGTGFRSGATVDFGPDVTVNSVTFVSATQIQANLTLAVTGATQPRGVNVKVHNPEVVFDNVARAFTITPLVDTDMDGVPDASDCAPGDPTLKHPATEVTNLQVTSLGGGSIQIAWDSQDATNGTATTYDVVEGSASDLIPDAGFASAVCAADNQGDTPLVTSAPVLGPGEVAYWLVSAHNACNAGAGTYGDSNLVPDPRDALDASPPCTSP